MVFKGLKKSKPFPIQSEISIEDERKNITVLVRFATALMETLKKLNKDALQDFKLRVGIAVGPVVAGVVGAVKPQYDIWGDTGLSLY